MLSVVHHIPSAVIQEFNARRRTHKRCRGTSRTACQGYRCSRYHPYTSWCSCILVCTRQKPHHEIPTKRHVPNVSWPPGSNEDAFVSFEYLGPPRSTIGMHPLRADPTSAVAPQIMPRPSSHCSRGSAKMASAATLKASSNQSP